MLFIKYFKGKNNILTANIETTVIIMIDPICSKQILLTTSTNPFYSNSICSFTYCYNVKFVYLFYHQK